METPQARQGIRRQNGSYLFLLLVEVVNDHTNEEVEGEEGAKYDENDKVDVHVDVDFIVGLVFHLGGRRNSVSCSVLLTQVKEIIWQLIWKYTTFTFFYFLAKSLMKSSISLSSLYDQYEAGLFSKNVNKFSFKTCLFTVWHTVK